MTTIPGGVKRKEIPDVFYFMKGNEKIAKLGKPSLIFGWGQQKRLDLIKRYVDFKGKKVLDVGSGIGMYSGKFLEEGAEVFGIDIDKENIKIAKELFPKAHFLLSQSESLPFQDDFFDIVFLNEVLEHVQDDRKTIQECLRVLKKRGRVIIFSPNRLFPFETHGIYLGKKYIYRNIPFVNWLPLRIRNIFCPHVRIYTARNLKDLFTGEKVSFEIVSYVYPALDKIYAKHHSLGKILKKLAAFFEGNHFFRRFGISVFMIVRKE